MEQKSLFEQTGITYSRQGDYLLPDFKLPDEEEYHIGVWGLAKKRFLKEHHKIMYYNLLASCKLLPHMAEVQEECTKRMEILVSGMAKKEGVTEALKATNPMEWVRRMNNIQNRAREIILNEIVYK